MYVHDLDPFAIQFTETFGVRWYGLAYLAGFVFGYYAILRKAKKCASQLKPDMVADFITYLAIGVLAGGRIGYVLFYSPDLLTSMDGHFPYWGVLKVNEGGMASHGGIIGVMLVCLWYARKYKFSFSHCLDLTVFGGSLGFCFGRIANFINGELFGREAPAGLSWAVKFPTEIYLWMQKDFGRMKSLAPVMDSVKTVHGANGAYEVTPSLWETWLNNYGPDPIAQQRVREIVDVIIAQIQSGNEVVKAAIEPILTPRYPSQLIQSVLEGLLVFLVLCWIWRKPQKPGVVGGWFGVLYCLARIAGEQFRMPDAHLGFQWLGLTRGQWLSVVFLSFSVAYLVFAYRRNAEKI
ncbi:MAG: prolipoprotein diacylglyceryl transferase [Bdellovibrionales bacterium]